jgi:hypothetical protein
MATSWRSLRDRLKAQGVTDEADIRKHLSFIHETLKVNPHLDLTRYKVNQEDPSQIEMG